MVPSTIGPQAHSWRSEGLTALEWTESPTPTEAGTRRDVYIRSERSDHKRKLVSSACLWVRSHLNSERPPVIGSLRTDVDARCEPAGVELSFFFYLFQKQSVKMRVCCFVGFSDETN